MDMNKKPEAVEKMVALALKFTNVAKEIRNSLMDEMKRYIHNEANGDKAVRVESRKSLFFYLTMIRHLNDSLGDTFGMEIVNEAYNAMCGEFAAQDIENNIREKVRELLGN